MKTNTRWNEVIVKARLVEAAETLHRLPDVGPQKMQAFWPDVPSDYGVEDVQLKPEPPSPEAIKRMDECLEWMRWHNDIAAKIVWLRAEGKPWKEIQCIVGRSRTFCFMSWNSAIQRILGILTYGDFLGGSLPKTLSKIGMRARFNA